MKARQRRRRQLARIRNRLLGIVLHVEVSGYWGTTARGHAVWVRPSFRKQQ